MKKPNVLAAFLLAFVLQVGVSAHAEESTSEKVGTAMDKTGDSAKKAYRDAKDKTCEMVNGKMECTAKKVGHKIQNATDSARTKAKETKNKVD